MFYYGSVLMINATLLYGQGGNDVTRDKDHVGAKGSIYARQKYKTNHRT
jgi:hypothetical protein